MSNTEERLKSNIDKARLIFLQEINERLPEALKSIDCIKGYGYDIQSIERLYKFTHTLRGSGETIGMFGISHPAAEMNVALKLIKNYGVKLEKGIIAFLDERLEEIVEEIGDNHSNNNLHFKISKSSNSKKKIYVIDDDATVTSLVSEVLTEQGFKVMAFHETKKAEKYIKIEQPDLIVLDIILSTEDEGIEFCRKIRSCECFKLIPIIFLTRKNELNDKLEGFANGADDYMGKPFQVEELAARVHSILNRLEIHQYLILRDELTQVYNRRYLEQRLPEEVAKAKRIGSIFSIAMIDIDFFKQINDEYGHATGDDVLQSFVELMNKSLRTSDVICRYGGDEFIVIFTDTPKAVANQVLERLRDEVAKRPVMLIKDKVSINITVSIGVAGFDEDGTSVDELILSADSALYNSKALGRNMVSLSKRESNNIV
jgi:two-component system, cell cycle response regulator